MSDLCMWISILSFVYLVFHALSQAMEDGKFRPLLAVGLIITAVICVGVNYRDIHIDDGQDLFLDKVTVVGEGRFRATIEVLYIDGELKRPVKIIPYSVRRYYHSHYPVMVEEVEEDTVVHSRKVPMVVKKKVPVRRAD